MVLFAKVKYKVCLQHNSRQRAVTHCSPWSQGCKVTLQRPTGTDPGGTVVSGRGCEACDSGTQGEAERALGAGIDTRMSQGPQHCGKSSNLVFGEQGRNKTGYPSITQMAHLGPSRSSKLPLHGCRGNHSAETPEGMERGEGRWRRHVVTFLEKPICFFLPENHTGGGGTEVGIGV